MARRCTCDRRHVRCCHTASARVVKGVEPTKGTVMEARFNLFENEVTTKFFKRLIAASRPIAESTLPKATQELVKIRASQINGCGMCLDMHTKDAAAAGETAVRLAMVAAWREAVVFTEAERAALALAEEGTRLADAHAGVSDATWSEVREH